MAFTFTCCCILKNKKRSLNKKFWLVRVSWDRGQRVFHLLPIRLNKNLNIVQVHKLFHVFPLFIYHYCLRWFVNVSVIFLLLVVWLAGIPAQHRPCMVSKSRNSHTLFLILGSHFRDTNSKRDLAPQQTMRSSFLLILLLFGDKT